MDELLAALDGLRLGQPLHFFREIGSTNDEARRLAQAGAPEGTLVAADTQTAGKGRAGRRWLTPPGTGLAFSLVLRPALAPAHAVRLTMLAGVAAAEAVESVSMRPVALKWPNDVLVEGAKAGGILVESGLMGDRLNYAVVGIGLNVSAAPPPEVVDFPATALQTAGAPRVNRWHLLRAILTRMEAHYPLLTSSNAEAMAELWAARLAWLGESVAVRGLEGDVVGRAEGVAADGALIIRLPSGEARRVLAGDVRLRKP
jgi:BirA family biotin operon repressor/biotin-[acetyl-CoA-carboxylase] ligase